MPEGIAVRCGGGGGGRGGVSGEGARAPTSADRRKVEKAVRSFPRITEAVGEDKAFGLIGATVELLGEPVEG